MKENSSNPTKTSSSIGQTVQDKDKSVNKRLAVALAARRSPDFFPIQLGRFAKIRKPKK